MARSGTAHDRRDGGRLDAEQQDRGDDRADRGDPGRGGVARGRARLAVAPLVSGYIRCYVADGLPLDDCPVVREPVRGSDRSAGSGLAADPGPA